MNPVPSIEQQLQALEESLLQADIRKSAEVSALLAERFVEIGSSGRAFNKAEVIAALKAEASVQITATDFKVQLLAPHIALVTYRALRNSVPPVHTLRSSIWEQIPGRWQIVFHQGTVTSGEGKS